MAVPTIRAIGSKSNGTTGAVTVSAPAGVATGDLELLISSTIAGGSVSITSNGGSAWTAITNLPVDVTGGEKLYGWYRIRQAGDSDPQVTPGSDHSCSCRIAITAGTFDTSDPLEIETTGSEATSDTSFSFAPGNSTADVDRLCFVVCTSGVDSNTGQAGTNTANASLANIALQLEYETTSGGGGGFWVATGERAAAGSVGTWTQTMVSATPKAYVSFAVKPAGSQTLSVGKVASGEALNGVDVTDDNTVLFLGSGTGTTGADLTFATNRDIHPGDLVFVGVGANGSPTTPSAVTVGSLSLTRDALTSTQTSLSGWSAIASSFIAAGTTITVAGINGTTKIGQAALIKGRAASSWVADAVTGTFTSASTASLTTGTIPDDNSVAIGMARNGNNFATAPNGGETELSELSSGGWDQQIQCELIPTGGSTYSPAWSFASGTFGDDFVVVYKPLVSSLALDVGKVSSGGAVRGTDIAPSGSVALSTGKVSSGEQVLGVDLSPGTVVLDPGKVASDELARGVNISLSSSAQSLSVGKVASASSARGVDLAPGPVTLDVGKVLLGVVETFDGSSLDTSKLLIQRLAANNFIDVSGGTLNMGIAAGFEGYCRVQTVKRWDFTGGEARVQVKDFGPDDAGTERSMYLLDTNADGTPDFNNGCYWGWVHSGAGVPTMVVWEIVDGVYTQQAGGTAPPAGEPWFRIRESGGDLFFDYSSDGINWTNRVSFTPAAGMYGKTVLLEYGQDNLSPAGATVKYDNFSVRAKPWYGASTAGSGSASLSADKVPSSSSIRGITATPGVVSLLAGKVGTSTAVRGVDATSGAFTLLAGKISSSEDVRGVSLSETLGISVGKITTSETTRGVSLAGSGVAALSPGRIGSSATARGVLVRWKLGVKSSSSLSLTAEPVDTLSIPVESTGSLSLASEPADELTLSPEPTDSLTLNPE